MLIEADAAPAISSQAQSGRSDVDPGGIAETHLQIQAGWISLLWKRARNPVGAIVIAAQIDIGSSDTHSENWPESLQAGQGIKADRDAVDLGGRPVQWALANLYGAHTQSVQTEAAIAADADGVAEGL